MTPLTPYPVPGTAYPACSGTSSGTPASERSGSRGRQSGGRSARHEPTPSERNTVRCRAGRDGTGREGRAERGLQGEILASRGGRQTEGEGIDEAFGGSHESCPGEDDSGKEREELMVTG